MRKIWGGFIGIACLVILSDQAIKWWIISSGFLYEGSVISFVLVYNKGVAFSMLAFLDGWLKYLQVGLLVGLVWYFAIQKHMVRSHPFALGAIFGAGLSNVLDRFLHHGVVDYLFWHYQFEFAVFNFADVMINLGVAFLFYEAFVKPLLSKNKRIIE